MVKRLRCDAVVIQIVATEHDAMGRPVGELTSAPTKVFRATARDFWGDIDKAVASMDAERRKAAETSAPASKKKGAKA